MSLAATFHRIGLALRKARSVVVCGHVRPDGDAVGATLALTLALRDAGVPAVPTLADPGVGAPATYAFLPGFALYAPLADLETPEVFVALDTPTPDRIGVALPVAQAAETLIVIDHHPDAQSWGTHNALDMRSAATGEIVWELLGEMGLKRSQDVAFCSYVAVVTDTGSFQHDNTSSATLRHAAEMIDAGAAPAEAARLVYQSRRPQALALEARAMSRLTLANGGHVAYSWVDPSDFEETGAWQSEAENLPDAIRRLGGVDVVAFFRTSGSEVRCGLRAKTGFDVSAVAGALGGGGHRAAAGFTWEGSLPELLEALLPLLPGGAE